MIGNVAPRAAVFCVICSVLLALACSSGNSPPPMSSGGPELDGPDFRPQFFSGGETITVSGRYLGSGPGSVRLEGRHGESVHLEPLKWSDESVSFRVPTGLSGLWDLVVSNGVGTSVQQAWCTFSPLPGGATGKATEVAVVGVNQESHDTATAIQFEGCLWVFDTKAGSDEIVSDCYNGSSKSWVNTPDPPGESYTQQAPLIVNGVLWLFNTTKNGTVEYSRYDSAAGRWSSFCQVPNVTTPNHSAVGVAYNDAVKPDRIELYYYNNGKIYRTYTDNHGGSWSTPSGVISGAGWGPDAMFWESAVYWNPTEGVTVPVPNATLVCYQISNGIAVAYLQDGKLIYTEKKTVNATLSGFLPKLVDLGEDDIAVVSGDMNCQPAIRKMSKATGKWESTWKPLPYDSNSPCWNPTGAVGSTKVQDPSSKGGYRYDTYFYLFYGYNGGGLFDKDEWKMKNLEYLGYYTEPGSPVRVDFSAEMHDTFYLWPVIGIMDAPPFVLNGHSIHEYDCIPAEECTRAEFGAETGQEVEVGLGGSIGPYVETGEKCPVKVEISAEINADVNKEWNKSQKQVSTLFRSLEGNVMLFYVVPEVQTHTYQWYGHCQEEAGKALYVVELLKLTLQTMIFDPRESPCPGCLNMPENYWKSFPIHAAEDDLERLSSYSAVPGEPALFDSTATWNSGGEAEIEWTTDASKSLETGVDIEFKIGKGGMIGGGVEGSFTLHMKTTTSVMTNANTYLVNFDAEKSGDIKRFAANGYWLNPNGSAYWLPTNRQGLGDQPWFITYYVSGILEY